MAIESSIRLILEFLVVVQDTHRHPQNAKACRFHSRTAVLRPQLESPGRALPGVYVPHRFGRTTSLMSRRSS